MITCKDTKEEILKLDNLCPAPKVFITTISCIIVAILIFLLFLTLLYHYYSLEIKVWLYAHQYCLRLITEKDLDENKIYDAFISYSHKDEETVIPELISNLEDGPIKFKLCLHFRDWLPGEYISRNIAKSIAESRRTITILSENFIKSDWGKMEFRTAHKQALEENKSRVIIVLVGEIKIENLDDELRAYLRTNTYVKWGSPWFWDQLRYVLPRYRRKVVILKKNKCQTIDLRPVIGENNECDMVNFIPSPV